MRAKIEAAVAHDIEIERYRIGTDPNTDTPVTSIPSFSTPPNAALNEETSPPPEYYTVLLAMFHVWRERDPTLNAID